jgi:hypothetical protein
MKEKGKDGTGDGRGKEGGKESDGTFLSTNYQKNVRSVCVCVCVCVCV